MKYKVCTLDVWGNVKEGYDINNYFTLVESVNINSDVDMTNFLREYLKGEPSQYTIDDDYSGFIEVLYEGLPILHFNVIYEE